MSAFFWPTSDPSQVSYYFLHHYCVIKLLFVACHVPFVPFGLDSLSAYLRHSFRP